STIFDHTELAEYLISMGADIDYIDCKGLSPLLLATNCGAWRSVALLLSKGANVNIKDKSGCNFLHLAILQPKGLKNLTGDILQHSSMMDLLSTEDNEGCTPLHYACRLGIHESVKNILVLQVSLDRKSKDKKSALHFAAQYGRINTCQRLLETITDSRLLNEGDERGLTPLHLASGVDTPKWWSCCLSKGALFHRC
ncbi:transient receptor potential cation channel subfamily A member 1-like, partial [Oncorhynchus masou masou]|uniref:transient receptor potential cation channel subfamily A member 1-like n=1 Tax=Oncorhynchus masou masou TaxID=90313 RepID=UPI00318426B8